MRTETQSLSRVILLQWSAFWLGIACLLMLPHDITGDGWMRFSALREVLRSGHFGSMRCPWIQPLLAIPLELLSPDSNLTDSAASHVSYVRYFNILVFYVGLAALWRLLRGILNAAELRVFLILLMFGSLLSFSTLDFFSETFNTMTIGAGLVLLARNRYLWATPLLMLGVDGAPALGLSLALVVGVHCWQRKTIWPFSILGFVAALVLTDRWLNVHSFHDRWNYMLSASALYQNDHGLKTFMPFSGMPGFSYPFILGVFSILFSFGKGLAWFLPGFWIPLWWRPERPSLKADIVLYWCVFAIGMVLTYARWQGWYGGYWWGPRYFYLCSLPASLLLAEFVSAAKSRLRVGFALVLVTAAFWVCASGLLWSVQNGANGYDICVQNDFSLESACWYIPEFSPIFRPLVLPQIPQPNWKLITLVWTFGFASLAMPMILNLANSIKPESLEDGTRALSDGVNLPVSREATQ